MQQVLTTPKGTKFVQPELWESKPEPKDWPKIGDRIESLHRLSKGEQGTVTGVYSKSITYQPDGSENEIYLTIGQFFIIKEEKNCSNCKRNLRTEEGLYCFPKNAIVKPENYCKKFEPKPSIPSNLNLLPDIPRSPTQPENLTPSKTCGPCSECNSFDSSTPKDSIWQFCLSKGKYLSQDDLKGCEDFKPVIPYKPLKKHRRTKGDGSGYIGLHPIVKNGKTYDQYYYHYEIWEGGQLITKSCRYIPKKKLETIQSLEKAKAPVTKILYELGLII